MIGAPYIKKTIPIIEIGKEINIKNNRLPCQEIELFGNKDNLYPLSICSVITIVKN